MPSVTFRGTNWRTARAKNQKWLARKCRSNWDVVENKPPRLVEVTASWGNPRELVGSWSLLAPVG